MTKPRLPPIYKPPKGKCDMCNRKKATHWFGQTSVALCDDELCRAQNAANWQRLQDEIKEEERNNAR